MGGGAMGGRAANGGADGGGRTGALGLGPVVSGESFGLRGPALSVSIERAALSSGWSVTAGSTPGGVRGASVGPDGAGGGNTAGGSTGGLAGKGQALGGTTAGGTTGGFAGRGGAWGGNSAGGTTGGGVGGGPGGDGPGTNPGGGKAVAAAVSGRAQVQARTCDREGGVCPAVVSTTATVAAEPAVSMMEVAEPALPSFPVTAAPLNDGIGPEAVDAQDAAEAVQ